MKRTTLAVLFLWAVLPIAAMAQVKISVPARSYKVQETVNAKVESTRSGAVTFCVEFGQTSSKDAEIENTPSPFWVQRNVNGKWGTLLIGPDVGSNRAAVVLEAGESKMFSFRLNDSGQMRLRLKYWPGAIPNLSCKVPPKGSKLLSSQIFIVQ